MSTSKMRFPFIKRSSAKKKLSTAAVGDVSNRCVDLLATNGGGSDVKTAEELLQHCQLAQVCTGVRHMCEAGCSRMWLVASATSPNASGTKVNYFAIVKKDALRERDCVPVLIALCCGNYA